MKTSKRVFAIVGVILLAALYLSTLVFAILGKEFMNWLMAAIAASIMLPVIIWLYEAMYRALKGKKEEEERELPQ